jgi:hypothetical protein
VGSAEYSYSFLFQIHYDWKGIGCAQDFADLHGRAVDVYWWHIEVTTGVGVHWVTPLKSL